jgi:hypothetical protein
MNLNKSQKFSSEYCARIVNIKTFETHPNPNCTRMKCAIVGAYSISVSIDTEPGMYIYFPVGCQINGEYLSVCNLFRKAQMNQDPTQTGFFEDKRRVKPIKLQGYPSEGFLMPYESLVKYADFKGFDNTLPDVEENFEFDSIEDQIFVNRYVVRALRIPGQFKPRGTDGSKKFSKLVEGQFRFHYETDSLEKMPWVIKPWNLIHVSTKMHGTSGISSYVLCKKVIKPEIPHIPYRDRNGKKLIAKAKIHKIQKRAASAPAKIVQDYDYLFASRKVVKNEDYNDKVNAGYYGNDEFRVHADNVLRPHIIKGMTIYYEIVGFTTTGSPIQAIKGTAMDYRCVPPKEGEPYTYGKHFDILIYRITLTNPDGFIHEFSAHEIQIWCKQHDLHAVKELYWGFAKDLYPDLNIHDPNWAVQFCRRIKEDQGRFFMELDSPDCNNPVPHEGVVIRIDDGKSAAYKVKCFRFVHKEDQDYEAGVVNREDEDL